MFNNLGLYSGVGFSRLIIPVIRPASLRRLPIQRRCVAPAVVNFGGSGNDIINIGGAVGPAGPSGPQGIQGIQGIQGEPGSPGLVPVTDVTATPYTVLLTDYYLAVDVATAASIVLPIAPTGTVFIVKDIDGDAVVNPITVTATASTIDGADNALIATSYGSLTFIFNGTEWNLI